MYSELENTTAFEVSWEVCNKVGGIYTVVSSKALQAVEVFNDNYYLFGPDLGNNAEFEETDEECWESIRPLLIKNNFQCRLGRWDIPGKPKTILVNFKDKRNVNQLLYELWNQFGVDSMTGGWDYAEPVVFSSVCGEIISTIFHSEIAPNEEKAVAHFHEWMCGAGLLYVKKHASQIGTVFTTHATMLGRAMAGTGCDIYKQMHQINPTREAANHNITAKCSMEKVSAREADCFTTVSSITAKEASVFLARTPDVLTLNGLDMRVIADYSEDRSEVLKYRSHLKSAIEKLLRRQLPENIRFLLISGRYEFRNKGLDVFLKSLAKINEALRGTDTQVIALCAVMGGHTGVNANAISGEANQKPPRGENWITSHNVYDAPNDPILNTCINLGLDNAPDKNVQVVFVPAQLNGEDGFINLTYEETLAACDLGVFPSWYEPWGYTPQESVAWAVPTVTTDLSGFGNWSRQIQKDEGISGGVYVISREDRVYEQVLEELSAVLMKAISQSEEDLLKSRKDARNLSNYFTWEKFYPNYKDAYIRALEHVDEREGYGYPDDIKHVLKAKSSVTPLLRSFMAISALPTRLKRLYDLSDNLWWCWQSEAWSFFSSIDSDIWENCEHNPLKLLASVPGERLEELNNDSVFLEKMDSLLEKFDNYMAEPVKKVDEYITEEHPVAYFSTEYGLCEMLPIYSGGLGVLSGDHLKSASDLNTPLVAVGLLYKNGYFQQKIAHDGSQIAIYKENDFSTMALERVLQKDGESKTITLDLPGRKLHAQIWMVKVGRIKLYLLDTDLPINTAEDRKTTAQLYVGDRDCRLRQEILLGMGGVKALQELGIEPSVYHMNEGHSAFLILQRIRDIMHQGNSFEVASEAVRASCVFTTHTPVDAGNERFSHELMERYFTDYANCIDLPFQRFLDMGRIIGSNKNMFEMTVLALNYSNKANGVSKLHGDVSRSMWQSAWKGYSRPEVPIGSVTNGIHVSSYVSEPMSHLLDDVMGENWAELPPEAENWERIYEISPQKLWDIKKTEKEKLLRTVDKGLASFFKTMNVPLTSQNIMRAGLSNSNALIIGFARRFAPYKRANLLFAEPKRLQRLLNDARRPVIFIFSGKAHPADQQGIDIMREIVKYTLDERFIGHIYFLEDYSLAVSRLLTRACDVWLNTPYRPNEASGTSGMKLSVNGGVNLSISDGWWCEGFNEKNGWTIGPVISSLNNIEEQASYTDAESLYKKLEDVVVPLYFDRDSHGLPLGWLDISKNAMRTLTANFSSHRMVNDYIKEYYTPTAMRKRALFENNLELAKRISDWKHAIAHTFPAVTIDEVTFEGVSNDLLYVGQKIRLFVTVNANDFDPKDLGIELVIGHSEAHEFIEKPKVFPLDYKEKNENGKLLYTGEFSVAENGRHSFGVRAVPYHPDLPSSLDTRLVIWA